MWKKALWPLVWILAGLLLLAGLAYFYEQHWGLEGPFPDTEHHHH